MQLVVSIITFNNITQLCYYTTFYTTSSISRRHPLRPSCDQWAFSVLLHFSLAERFAIRVNSHMIVCLSVGGVSVDGAVD